MKRRLFLLSDTEPGGSVEARCERCGHYSSEIVKDPEGDWYSWACEKDRIREDEDDFIMAAGQPPDWGCRDFESKDTAE